MYEGRTNTPNTPNAVVLTERDAADAARLLSILLGPEADSAQMSLCGPAPAGDQAEAVELTFDDLRQLSCKIFASRQARCRFFNKAMFGEPGWDMLLALYSMEVAGPRQTVGRLTEKSGAPPTSALRWLNFLEEEHLVSREPHPNDGRTTFIELTDKGRKAIEDYLFSISQQFGLG